MTPPHPTSPPTAAPTAPTAPTAADLEARTAFLDLGPADAEVLAEFGVLYPTLAPALIERFYEHLLAHPATARLLQDEAILARLKPAQAGYFARLFGGRYDEEYARDRLRVGATHQRVGLAPAYYTGAYALYLRLLMPSVLAELAAQPDRALATLEALLKVVFLDVGLAMDTYIDAQQQDLRALRDFADRVIASVPVALVVVDAAGRVLRWNRAFERLLGARPTAGAVLPELVGAPALARRLPDVLRGDAPQAGLLLTLHTGAGSRPARVAMAPLASPAGESARVVCVIEDLTDEVRLSSRLQATDRQLHALLERSRDPIILTRPDGTIAFCNAAAEALFGYGREELRGAAVAALVTEPCRPAVQQLLAGAARGGPEAAPVEAELEALLRDGRSAALTARVSADQVGDAVVCTFILRDLAAGQTQAVLRRHDAALREAFDRCPDFVAVHRLGRLLYVNPAAAQLLGRPAQSVVGHAALDLVAPPDHEQAAAVLLGAGRALGPVLEQRLRLVRADGDLVTLSLTLTPALFDGEPACVVLGRDLTPEPDTLV